MENTLHSFSDLGDRFWTWFWGESPIVQAQFWNSIWGAVLGASFYLLLRNYKLLSTRTYNPKFDRANKVRLVLGVVSGAILPQVLALSGQGEATRQFQAGLVAILGGFSAEAVELILQRFVEVLVAVVRGDNSTAIEAEKQKFEAKVKTEESKRNSLARDRLMKAKATAPDQPTKDAIDQALAAMG